MTCLGRRWCHHRLKAQWLSAAAGCTTCRACGRAVCAVKVVPVCGSYKHVSTKAPCPTIRWSTRRTCCVRHCMYSLAPCGSDPNVVHIHTYCTYCCCSAPGWACKELLCRMWLLESLQEGGGVGQLQPAGRSLAQAVCMLAACKPHTSMHDVVFTYVDCASSLQQNSSGVFHKCNSNICNPGSGCSTGASHRRCTDDFLPVLY